MDQLKFDGFKMALEESNRRHKVMEKWIGALTLLGYLFFLLICFGLWYLISHNVINNILNILGGC